MQKFSCAEPSTTTQRRIGEADEGEWSTESSDYITPGVRALRRHYTIDRVGSKVGAKVSMENTKISCFYSELWSLDIPARRLVTAPNELLRLEIQQSAMITSNLEPVNQGTPFCAEGPLLAATLCLLINLDSWCGEQPTSLSYQGYLVNKAQKCMRSVATGHERSIPVSSISPIHHPLTVNLISQQFRWIT